MARELLEKVVAEVMAEKQCFRYDAMWAIAREVELDLFGFAKARGVLVQNSAADFAMQFYSEFNNTIEYRY